MSLTGPFWRLYRTMLFNHVVLSLIVVSTLIVLPTLFPGSAYVVIVAIVLIQLTRMMIFLSQSSNMGAGTHGQYADWSEKFGKRLENLIVLIIILTGYSLSYFHWGTLPSAGAFMVSTALAIYYIGKSGFKRIRIFGVRNYGYTFFDPEWKIEVNQVGNEKKYYLTQQGRRANLYTSELPALYELGELARQGKTRKLSSTLHKVHALRTSFRKNEWTVIPSSQPGVYAMYRADLADLVTISKRDASWLVRFLTNNPEDLLLKIRQIDSRLKTYKNVTRDLKNVTYAGNDAVISTSNGLIYVDLHSGSVYKEKDWSGLDLRFICIIPRPNQLKNDGNPIVQYGSQEGRIDSLKWEDAIILSKIFNISRETPSVRKELNQGLA